MQIFAFFWTKSGGRTTEKREHGLGQTCKKLVPSRMKQDEARSIHPALSCENPGYLILHVPWLFTCTGTLSVPTPVVGKQGEDRDEAISHCDHEHELMQLQLPERY